MRFASASLAAVALAACATSPPPLPPRRPAAEAVEPAPPSAHPPDLEAPTEPPIVHERYFGWTLAADAAAIYPLGRWVVHPDRAYLALPALALSPIVHAAHGEPTKAVTSLLVRGAMLAAVYGAARRAEEDCRGAGDLLCVPIGPMVVIELAITAAITTDAFVLARRTRTATGWRRLPVLPLAGRGAHGLSFVAAF